MRSDIESVWLFAIASKCKSINTTTSFLALLFLLSYLLINFIYWAHPGGPAWGRHRWRRRNERNIIISNHPIIPGPKGLPVLGSLNLMSGLAHHKIAAAADACRAKRLMAFSIGETRAVVTCNPEIAKEILNSSDFADRPMKESAYALMFNRAIGFAPYGPYWRTLRKIAASHLFCPKQIRNSELQRSEIADQLVAMFRSRKGDKIPVRDALKLASLNNMMWSVFGKKYRLDSKNQETEELRMLVEQGYELLGVVNWSDHLSWLTDFDLQKVRFRCSQLVPKVNRFVTRIVNEHKEPPPSLGDTAAQHPDFVDVLLNLQGTDKLSESDMIAVLWEMIFRGTDTIAVLIEWILARMVLHPDAQSKVQKELDRIVGRSRAVTESDVMEMTYLPAVVKEVLRLHPPGPLLSWARMSITDTTVDGYHVPKGTTAMVNMWAITRDPRVWQDPLSFNPERFISTPDSSTLPKMDLFSVLGSDPRLAPFGSGRRTCPGKTLGLTTVTFWVASLLHEFEFLCAVAGEVDLSEVLRLSCEMANPLVTVVRPRRRCE